MNKKRTLSQINLGEDRVKMVVRIEGDECSPDTQTAYQMLVMLMRELTDMPTLVHCGTPCPAEVTFRHTGSRWVIEAFSIVNRGQNGIQATSGTGTTPEGRGQ